MHDGSIIFSTALDNTQLEKDLAGLTKKIEKQEQKIAELSSKRDKAREKGLFDAETLDREKAKLQEIKDRLADIRAMAWAATAHKLYHTTYYNHLAAWVRRCESAEEVSAITYGAELPEDLAEHMALILNAGEGTANA